ncbi:ligand-binding sensor domain-containing protein [Chryseolinea lacunae]|uniref:histidine kinase n=1 Tax=Chryseolinea lacunae TaxID=2801331 RepID=A0ABS1L1R4_9BACT|nr:sensor histidine kinase [Chryseolinea lacunae]MBL0745630.1 hypothetical protein [Chryseolinea lacunae]
MTLLYRKVNRAGVVGLLMLFSVCGLAQDIRFRHLSPDDGLFSGNVRTFVQDYQGFMWVGTDDGLYRYDGYDMVPFRTEKDNPHSLSDNFVLALFEDSEHNLWVGTRNGGLSLYDRRKNQFTNFKHDLNNHQSLGGNSVRAIYEDENKNMFIGTSTLSFFNLKDLNSGGSIAFTNVELDEEATPGRDNWINWLGKSADGTVWVATAISGLLVFDPEHGSEGLKKSPFLEKNVQSVLLDAQHRVWIGTWNDGVAVYDKDQRRIDFAPQVLRNNLVSSIQQDSASNVWLATDNGIAVMDGNNDPFVTQTLTTHVNRPGDESSVLSNSIKVLYFDRVNRLWVGSYLGGISIYDPHIPPFGYYHASIFDKGGLSHNNVTAMVVDHKGRLWVGTDGGGLNRVPMKDKKFIFDAAVKVPLMREVDTRSEDKIKCLALDDDNNLWIGTWGGGLFRLDTETGKYTHFGASGQDGNKLISNEVISLLAEGNNIWVGHFKGGLNYYNHETGTFKAFTIGRNSGVERINSMIPSDQPKKIWAGQEVGGVNIYTGDRGYVSPIGNESIFKGLMVYSIHKGADENLWIGSITYGLIAYNYHSKQATIYDAKNGLTNYRIQSILEDERKNLWLGTNQGIFKFDITRKQFIHYTKGDGLQGNQYNQNSALKLADGMMIFGGTNGLNYFYPDSIQGNDSFSPVVLTTFWLNDEEVTTVDSAGPLKESIQTTSVIDLQHFQNSFSVGFSALDFTQSKFIHYQYILEGLNDRWQQLGYGRKVTFTDLEPRTYVLKVKASNREKDWPQESKMLTIVIHPAWWQTIWFKIGVFAVLLSALFAVQRIRLRYLLQQKKNLSQLVAVRTNELAESTNEVLAQNEELVAQNEYISEQRSQLEETQKKLEQINDHLEDLVEKRTLKLDKTLRELDRFVYSASHELSSPLKSILGLINVADLEDDPEAIKKYHRYIEDSILKLERVIKSLADFSRNSHVKITQETFDLSALVVETVSEFKGGPDAGAITIRNHVPEGFSVKTDRSRMKIILHNLIGNSIKYRDATKPDPSVDISALHDHKHCWIVIADNGIGIKKESQSRVFDMYFRATERSIGSGLGLFIVKEIVTTLGGTITVQSVFGTGTTFTIQLEKE